MKRCSWVTDEPLYQSYHDEEWGRPLYDDRKLFELLCLEGAQAGLSWWTILQKRENYREAFDQFDAEKIVQYNEEKIAELLANKGIVRNRLKVRSVVKNAEAFLQMQQQHGSFAHYIWRFVDHEPILNHWATMAEVPTSTARSDAMSKQMKKDGFTFIGTTICYSFMQAAGLVNDHTLDCDYHPRNRQNTEHI